MYLSQSRYCPEYYTLTSKSSMCLFVARSKSHGAKPVKTEKIDAQRARHIVFEIAYITIADSDKESNDGASPARTWVQSQISPNRQAHPSHNAGNEVHSHLGCSSSSTPTCSSDPPPAAMISLASEKSGYTTCYLVVYPYVKKSGPAPAARVES